MTEEIIFETQRLQLRKVNPQEDAAFFIELVNSPKWLKYIGDRNLHTLETTIKYLEDRVMKSYTDNGYGGYIVIEKSSGNRVGTAGLYKRPVLDCPDVGYALLPAYEGMGYAFESANRMIELARELKLPKVYGITVAYHQRSIHLLEKLGLKFERLFRMENDPEELSLYRIDLA